MPAHSQLVTSCSQSFKGWIIMQLNENMVGIRTFIISKKKKKRQGELKMIKENDS